MTEPKPKRAAAKSKSTSSNAKVFDVRRPGRAPAQATSRPVIVGHKPQVKDPMVSEPKIARSQRKPAAEPNESKQPDAPPSAPTPPASPSPVAQSLSSSSQVLAEPSASLTIETPAGAISPQPDESQPYQVESSQPPLRKSDAPPTPDDNASPQPRYPAVQMPPASIAESDRVVESTVAPEVDMSRAVVSHPIRSRRRPWRALALWLGLLAALVVAADVLLDAGVVKPTFHVPHTHFLRSQ